VISGISYGPAFSARRLSTGNYATCRMSASA
jgi:hypothetical protein